MLPTIRLKTNDPEKEVILQDIENYHSAGCRCLLVVNSNGFMCRRKFEFENIDTFLNSLIDMKAALTGEANLSEEYSDNFIKLRALSLGQIEVTGTITKFDNVDQTLEFGFITDQTILSDLIKDFETLVV